MPGLLKSAGLTEVQTSMGGDTALAKVVVDQTTSDLGRIAIAALLANLLFLMLFMRALIAPVALLACGVLAIAATLGLTTWLFQDVLGGDGLTFYVPFAAAVLLVALGSDYNNFGIGRSVSASWSWLRCGRSRNSLRAVGRHRDRRVHRALAARPGVAQTHRAGERVAGTPAAPAGRLRAATCP